MSNLILLKTKEALEKITILQAIKLWIVNLFHVHEWIDEGILDRTLDGKVIGHIYIQICHCGKRRSQAMDSKGFEW
jgi:hypothetical protein